MLSIRLYGRDGQGAELGRDVLAGALRRSGLHARVATREDTAGDRADAALVLDAALVGGVCALSEDALLFVNAPGAPCGLAPHAGRVLAVDVADIAGRHGLGSLVATAMVGVFAGASGMVPLRPLADEVGDRALRRGDEHVAALAEGFEIGALMAGRRAPGAAPEPIAPRLWAE